jgi:hypothetical protein
MRKLTTLISVLLALGSAACGKDESAPKPTGGGTGATTEPAKAEKELPASTGLPDCDGYIKAVEAYVRCDKVAQSARESVKTGLDSMRETWGSLANVPEGVRTQTNDACKQAVDSLRQGAAAIGCPI